MRDQYSVKMVFSNLPSEVRFMSGSQTVVLTEEIQPFHQIHGSGAPSAPGLNAMREYGFHHILWVPFNVYRFDLRGGRPIVGFDRAHMENMMNFPVRWQVQLECHGSYK
jgi:hypothetical protein